MNIVRTMSWPYDPYTGTLPPPLCFTVPAGSRVQTSGHLQVSKGLKVTLGVENKMMDPSDASTWQRPYRFDTGQHGLMPGRFPQAAGARYY